jgi:hypothetical protein
MGDIFGRAENVIFWLGPPEEDTHVIMNFLIAIEEERRIQQGYDDKWTHNDNR